jgi:hypothetical protein
LILLFFLSCTDNFLDKEPSHGLDINTLANEEGIEGLLIGAYSNLNLQTFQGFEFPWGYPASPTNWVYGDVYADDAYKGSYLGDFEPILEMEKYMSRSQTEEYYWDWQGVYDGAAACNAVLQAVGKAMEKGNITAKQAAQYRAEARFLRAFYHLEAIKIWDFIPYIKEDNITGLEPNQVSSSAQEDGNTPWGLYEKDGYIPWAEVEADLDSASRNLPEIPRNGQLGRASKYAALGLWARVRMFQGKYSGALDLLNEIIQSGRYSLAHNFHDNFRISGDNNQESLFDIQASISDASITGMGAMNGNVGDVLNWPYTWETPIPGPGSGCCEFYKPSQNLVNAFKTQDGLPYISFFGLDFNAAGDDVKNDQGIASEDPFTPDTRPLDPRLDWTVGRRGIPHLDWGPHPGKVWIREQETFGPYSPKKNAYYTSEEGISTFPGWGQTTTTKNYHAIRYADILLMAAECEVEDNNLTRARDLVNMVRERAKNGSWVLENGAVDDGSHRGPDGELPAANYQIEVYPTGGPLDPFQNQASAREAVRFERRLEFGMEGMRFWDLKRWGIAKEVLNAYLAKENTLRPYLQGVVFDDRNVRHPISDKVIELSLDRDKNVLTLEQNPGF